MKRLAGMDASFVYMETPSAHMHVVGTMVIDPSTAPEGYSFEKVRHLLDTRLHLLPPFRRRLVPVPFNLDHPVWIEDPDFDLDNHLYRIAVPSPGSLHELAEVVGDIAGRPLDHQRPLWELWAVEGLDDGRVAIVTKMHHAAMDGVSGADLMVHLFDLEPDAPDVEPPKEPWHSEPLPSAGELISDALRDRIENPLRTWRLLARTARSMATTVRAALPIGGDGAERGQHGAPVHRGTGSVQRCHHPPSGGGVRQSAARRPASREVGLRHHRQRCRARGVHRHHAVVVGGARRSS